MNDTKASSHPTSWRWDTDGHAVRGTYVRMDEAATDYGRKAIVVLDVAGEERSVWLFEAATVSKFRDQPRSAHRVTSLRASGSRLNAALRRSNPRTTVGIGRIGCGSPTRRNGAPATSPASARRPQSRNCRRTTRSRSSEPRL